jgi:hypothetical protein
MIRLKWWARLSALIARVFIVWSVVRKVHKRDDL